VWFAGDSVGNSGFATSSTAPRRSADFPGDSSGSRTKRPRAGASSVPESPEGTRTWQASVPRASIASVTKAERGVLVSGVSGDNFGTAATAQQQAVGDGASNQSNTAQVNGSEFTAVHQGNAHRHRLLPAVVVS
jgi:hypothetical protein